MCGIVGYIGPREAAPILLEGLARLEYRGYDSAGIALVTAEGDLFVEKRAGKLSNLRTALLDATPSAAIGLAHTRWATHGRPNDLNAHPHVDCTGDITVIHNGIIENFQELRDGLAKRGHELRSETDTEALAHLVEEAYDGDIADAVRQRSRQAQGAYAVAVLHRAEPGRLVGARQNVPLIVGLGDGENFLASDVAAVLAHTDRVVFLEEGDVADLHADGVVVTGVDGQRRERPVHVIDWSIEAAEKGGYEHFMLKEMHEQPVAIRSAIAGRIHEATIRVPELDGLVDRIVAADRVELSPAAAPPTPRSSVPRPSRTGRACRPREHRLRVPLQPAAARRAHARHRRHAVGRDGRHHRARRASHASRAAPSSRSPIPWARPSPGSATRSCSCRPGQRSRSWPRRRS